MWLFSLSKFLGVDIGSSHIKIAEVFKSGRRKRLNNYGFLPAASFYEKPFRTFEQNTFSLSNQEISQAIRAIIEEAGMKARKAIFSIPDFATLFADFELPPMTREELFEAVKYEARQHIPIPLAQTSIDWQIIESKPVDKKRSTFKILLAAVPNDIVSQYQEIARLSQLELFALEAEAFSLIRALVRENEKELIAIVDIGIQSSAVSIVENGVLKISHSFDMSGSRLVKTVADSFNLTLTDAEKLVIVYGLQENKEIREILFPLIEAILKEIEKVLNEYQTKNNKKIQKIILAGGWALLPGLKEFMAENLKINIEIANPFVNVAYPSVLAESLKKLGPSFAIAIGAALRGWSRG
ncbi:MAG: type IV pilus assembly protein PilM [Minisyncoccales bacterium]